MADYWLTELGQAKMYGTPSQIDWLETPTFESKPDFFQVEQQVTEYQRLERSTMSFSTDADF